MGSFTHTLKLMISKSSNKRTLTVWANVLS
jgi:hypothetical protein